MPVGTRKSNVDAHPGRIVLDSQQTRRTKRQIEADEASAEAEASAARQAADTQRRASVARIAGVEDSVMQEEESVLSYTNRPDLRTQAGHIPLPATRVVRANAKRQKKRPDPWSETGAGPFDYMNSDDSSGPVSVSVNVATGPETTLVDEPSSVDSDDTETRGSDNEGPGLVDSGEEQPRTGGSLRKRGKRQRRQGSDDEGSVDSGEEQPRTGGSLRKRGKRQRREGKAKVVMRAEIDATRRVATSVAGKKPKASPLHATGSLVQRLKNRNCPEGLIRNWNSKVPIPIGPTVTRRGRFVPGVGGTSGLTDVRQLYADTESNTDSQSEPASEDDDESTGPANPAGAITSSSLPLAVATRPIALSGPANPKRSTAKMGVGFYKVTQAGSSSTGDTNATVSTASGRRASKDKVTLSDLPYQQNKTNSQTWRNVFVPTLLRWAGAQEDPFGANFEIKEVVRGMWDSIFPNYMLDEQGLAIVEVVSENTLNNWRSELGKAGHRTVVGLLDGSTGSPLILDATDRAELGAYALTGWRFVYKNPDAAEISDQGPFCSDPIARVYSIHLKKISKDRTRFPPQIGALALATVAVERGLTMLKTGEDLRVDTGHRKSQNSSSNQFAENPWGARVRETVLSTTKLRDRHWVAIHEHCTPYMGKGDLVPDKDGFAEPGDDAEMESMYPRANIRIDW